MIDDITLMKLGFSLAFAAGLVVILAFIFGRREKKEYAKKLLPVIDEREV